MNFIVLGQLGALIKWLITGCKNKYINELYGEGKHTHFLKILPVESENIILGLCCISALIIIFIII
jgi:hypothetical protein